jgi:plastocyanin
MRMRNLALSLLLLPSLALAANLEMGITIKDHRFIPSELKVPAGKKIKLVVSNQDSTPEEFESHQLNREKVIAGNSKATIYVGPLAPGKYTFWGEFNEKTARGVIVAE